MHGELCNPWAEECFGEQDAYIETTLSLSLSYPLRPPQLCTVLSTPPPSLNRKRSKSHEYIYTNTINFKIQKMENWSIIKTKRRNFSSTRFSRESENFPGKRRENWKKKGMIAMWVKNRRDWTPLTVIPNRTLKTERERERGRPVLKMREEEEEEAVVVVRVGDFRWRKVGFERR